MEKKEGTKLCCCLGFLEGKRLAYMYLKRATNGTNVSKCCSIYFWTPCCRPSGQEDPSNGNAIMHVVHRDHWSD